MSAWLRSALSGKPGREPAADRIGCWHGSAQLPPSPLSARDHPVRNLAVPPLHPELPRCRGIAGRTRARHLLRNGAAMGAGVPRDALNLIGKAAAKSFGQKIAMNDVRAAARDWYHQDKANAIRGNPVLSDLLQRIIEEIIGDRRARAFLFQSMGRNEHIEQLFDARLLHILRKNVSSHDTPGVRYDVYKI